MNSPIPFTILVKISVTCVRCFHEAMLFDGSVMKGNRLPELEPPPGWTLVNGEPLCDAHVVQVTTPDRAGERAEHRRLREGG